MKKITYLVVFCCVSYQALANDVPKWVYPNGEVVPLSVVNEVAAKCKIEEAANDVANAKSGEFEQVFAQFLDAHNCMKSSGIMLESSLNE